MWNIWEILLYQGLRMWRYGVNVRELEGSESTLRQGSPTLLGTGPKGRRWVAGEWVKLHLYLQPLPSTHITTWDPPPVRSAAALDSHRNTNSTVNCACEASRLHTPYKNLMSDDTRWSEVVMLELASRCKYRLSLVERFDCTETIINQLLADSY